MITEYEVEEFIKRRFPINCDWTYGNCFYFAKILEARFPTGKIWYDVIKGHFLYEIEKTFYDYTGKVERSIGKDYILWDKMKQYDKNLLKWIIQDRIK